MTTVCCIILLRGDVGSTFGIYNLGLVHVLLPKDYLNVLFGTALLKSVKKIIIGAFVGLLLRDFLFMRQLNH